ncbi:helix-turn-helix domain-containing protein [Pararhizobium sp. O133]|uniref:helix-turn-helix domain-containing protein n=1 Tax=Pararhizobium sp. O133 TaxID=3449278 RepID=UPI003F68317C
MSAEPTIRRGERNARYAAIPNHVFEDVRLSMEARWLLSYLLSKPDNWTVVVGDIVKKGNCGRDKARKMIAELVDLGYAEREQSRADGKFGVSILVIYDEPRGLTVENNSGISGGSESVAFLPQTDLPSPVKPSPVSPSPVKSAHSNNSDLANTDDSNLREGASEGEEDPKKVEAAFWRLVKDWPGFDGMPKKPAMAAWLKLTAEERTEASDRFTGWLALLKGQKKDHVPAPSTYFGERLWRDVPAMQEAAKPKNAMVPAFGKLWGAYRLAELLAGVTGAISGLTATEKTMVDAGKWTLDRVRADKRRNHGYPNVNTMHERARNRQGWICPLALEGAAQGFAQVRRDSDLMVAWMREHERRNWPFLDARSLPEWVYLPAIASDADGLDIAVRDAVDAFAEQISDYLKERSKGDDDAA